MRRAWLRRIRVRFWILAAGLGLVVVLPLGVYASDHPDWRWGFGFVAGACVAVLIALRESPPGYIASWEEGSWAEQWTAKKLRPLRREGWTVLHDRRDKRGDGKGNFDHVLVGPAGVFLLDSKRWPGTTTIEDGVPTLRRHEDPDLPANVYESLPGRQRSAAMRLKRALQEQTRIAAWVSAVVVIWGDFPAGIVEADNVTFVRGDLVRDWLAQQPGKLIPEHQSRVAGGLSQALTQA